MTIDSLDIKGYNDNPVANTFYRQDEQSGHIAIMLPGFAYPCDRPLLYYPGLMTLQHGADLLRVEYAYNTDTEFLKMSEEGRANRFRADITAACRVALQQGSYSRLTLVGKSIGTLAMAHLITTMPSLPETTCSWLTPLLRDERLQATLSRFRPRSLFAIGTADQHYDVAILDEVLSATNGTSVVVEGANHGLEIVNDVAGCMRAVERVVEAMDELLGAAG